MGSSPPETAHGDAGTLPGFFIPGAPKAGTTSLYHYLASHPQVCMGAKKEPGFFLPHSTLTLAEYQALFHPAAGETVVGDATPLYLASAGAVKAIAEQIPNARFVVSLRQPVMRALSHYRSRLLAGQEHRPLGEILRTSGHDSYLLRHSAYGSQLKRLLGSFDRSAVHVFWFEDLVADPTREVQRIQGFLGLRPEQVDTTRQHNVTSAAGNAVVARLAGLPALRRSVRLLPGPVRRLLRAGASWLHALGTTPAWKLGCTAEDVAVLDDMLRPEVERLRSVWGEVHAGWRERSA